MYKPATLVHQKKNLVSFHECTIDLLLSEMLTYSLYTFKKKTAPRTFEEPLHLCDPHQQQSLCPHLLSSLFFLSSLFLPIPTTKSCDDPSVPLCLRPSGASPPSGCFLFQNPLRDNPPPAVMMGEGMGGIWFVHHELKMVLM